MRPQTYAPIIAAAFVLWIIVSLLGGQGFTPLLVLTGLAGLAFKKPELASAQYAWLLGAAIIWACITAVWAPGFEGLWSGSIFTGDFDINAAGLRILGIFLFGGLMLQAAFSIPVGVGERSRTVMLGSVVAQGLIWLLLFVFLQQVLELVYGDDVYRQLSEGRQNAMRTANAFALSLAVMLPALWLTAKNKYWRYGGLIVVGVFLMIFQKLGSQSAVLGLICAGAAYGLVRLAPQRGLKWMIGGLATYVATAPILISIAGFASDKLGLTLPGSFLSRLFAWRFTTSKIAERPFTGHGMEASTNWRETYADRPDWLADLIAHHGAEAIEIAPWETYPIVPGHPHNMPLQIWAETGMIGALLVAGALLALALRLPKPGDMLPDVRYGIAGMIGASLPMFSFAYSVWNEAFWAMIIIAASGLVLLARTQAKTAP